MPSADDRAFLNGLTRALISAAPSSEATVDMMLFGQFVGDWKIAERKYIQEDGSWKYTTGELHCSWILGGMATQDIWIAHDRETGQLDQMGTTVRFPATGENFWRSVWISPMHNTVMQFTGGKVGDDIVLESREEGGETIRWIFYDIERDEFRWRADVSIDNGKSWNTTTEMRIFRISRKALAD